MKRPPSRCTDMQFLRLRIHNDAVTATGLHTDQDITANPDSPASYDIRCSTRICGGKKFLELTETNKL